MGRGHAYGAVFPRLFGLAKALVREIQNLFVVDGFRIVGQPGKCRPADRTGAKDGFAWLTQSEGRVGNGGEQRGLPAVLEGTGVRRGGNVDVPY